MRNEELIIAIDLDGTLLTAEKKILPRTKKALQEASRLGHHIVICTGRPFRSSARYYQELGLKTPIVNFNGALVHHPLNKDWGMFHTPLDKETANTVIQMSQEIGIRNIMMEVLDHVYIQDPDQLMRLTFLDEHTPIQPLPEQVHQNPTSLLLQPEEEHVESIIDYLNDAHAEVIDHRKWNAPWHVIEVVKYGLSKAVGLQRVCDHFNLPPTQVVAFGDENNDLEMLQFAGTGVAMGNAIEPLKELATSVTASNEEDGIALFLEKHIL